MKVFHHHEHELRPLLDRWFAGDAIVGVYECTDESSKHFGRRCAIPFDKADEPRLIVGESLMPAESAEAGFDSKAYRLVALCTTTGEALAMFPGIAP